MGTSSCRVRERHFMKLESVHDSGQFIVNLQMKQESSKSQGRCFFLHDQASFKEELMMAFRNSMSMMPAQFKSCGSGFDQKGIQYGYPPQYLIDWTIRNRKMHPPERKLSQRPRGYHTISSATIKNFDVDEKYKERYEPYGFKYSLQTMFFDASGSRCAPTVI